MTKPGNIAELKDPCLDPEAIIGQVLKKSVSMNQVISEHDLDMPVLIERRQVVTMFLQKGSLQISDKGLASANGKMGDVIMIKNLKSNREVPCRVIGPGMTSGGILKNGVFNGYQNYFLFDVESDFRRMCRPQANAF
jgi:flagella basal body P-ring formation protein FlgA